MKKRYSRCNQWFLGAFSFKFKIAHQTMIPDPFLLPYTDHEELALSQSPRKRLLLTSAT
ncbi:hypothetical protein COMA2_10413 [Candidatus Nitrospira nitrificans]|uniref:Uncharacterized protein n=1 Tax=Candidatus Nitrospira nitrificans TaxID=1742973 RepID=A0A0S4L7Z9_9BACT|nr:hypothetical protein COMA2_10413 [Candidatus Nitrospira nitrificans]